ncbi:Choline dehydrogenase [Mesorhizobium sp. NFR06]|nr:Choline dehydrogenase [Mesorhizobium sp. NFR06]
MIARPDAIIVGSGAGGSTAARILTKRGWNVVVLEKGGPVDAEDFLPFDELHFREHKTLIPKIVDDPMIYAGLDGNSPVRSERWWEVTMVGGSTNVWDANFPRYTTPDFDVTPYMKGIPNAGHMVKWPWSYEEFRPWFEMAEWDWAVSGAAGQSEEEMRAGYQYPMPVLKPHQSSAFLRSLFRKAGLKPYFGARAINSQTYDGRPACSFCGFCQFFGCAVNSRANAANTMLRRALATGRCDLRVNHYVIRVEHEPGPDGRRRIRGVWYVTEPGGPEQFMASDRVIVSVQTIQSARLFLLSEVPDPYKLVGRFLTYHTKGDAHFTFPGKGVWNPGLNNFYQPVTAIGSLQLRGLYTYKDSAGDMRKGGKFSVYDPFTCTTPLRLVKGASLGPSEKNIWGANLVNYMEELRTQGGVSVSFTGDAMSLYNNRVELDPVVKDPWGVPVPKTFYRHDPWDLATSRFALDTIAEAVGNAGGELRKNDPQDEANPGYGHVHGALRAGADRGASVLNLDCESHEVAGLTVLDAAWMPTAGASNPSLTLLANAYRVCTAMPQA